jgi:hypothetical protein
MAAAICVWGEALYATTQMLMLATVATDIHPK